jgi:hypothetical protein
MTDSNFPDDERSYSDDELCRLEGFSQDFLRKLRSLDIAPRSYVPLGTRLRRTTAQARREWHELMERLTQSEAGKREAARRSELATVAARLAVQSAKHPSKRKPR